MTAPGPMVLVGVMALTACVDHPDWSPAPLSAFRGIEEADSELAQLANPCAFDAGSMTITLAAGEYSLIGQTLAGELRVNGRACGASLVSNTTRINITGSADGGSETVILDYLNGPFVLGTAGAPGITIDLRGGNDKLKVRTSDGLDTVALGTVTAGIGSAGTFSMSLAINADGGQPDLAKDITFTGIEAVVVSTGPGADIVNGAGVVFGTGSLPFGSVLSGTNPTLSVYGGDGPDVLTGGAGADALWGEAGNDTITGGLGNDVENGGPGDDAFSQGATANGTDSVTGGSEGDGGAGRDSVSYELRSTSITAVIGGGAISGAFLSDGGFENDSLATLEVVWGGGGNDVLACAGASGCTLHGSGGNDSLTGSSADDSLYGEGGNDTILPGPGDDLIDCGASTTDTVSYADRSVSGPVRVILGAAGVARTGNGDLSGADGGLTEDDSIALCENVVGGAGDDTLTGNELDNRITGGLGDDTLSGGDGNDLFDEGAVDNGSDVIAGGPGEDLVDYSHRSAALSCDMSDDAANDGESGENDNLKTDVEDLTGGSGGLTLVANDGDNKIDPGSGTNSVTCGLGFDILIPNGTTTNAANDCEATAAPLVSIAVTPTNPTSIKNTTRQFTAVGRYSDSTTQTLTNSPALTWASSSTSTAIISNSAGSRGLASTMNPGVTTISATVGAVTGSTSFTVVAASLISISITPANVSVALGFTRTFLAVGTYTDGTTQDLSTQVTWASSASGVAIISNTAGSQGLASTLSMGSTTITAVMGSVTGSTTLTVTAAMLVGPIVVTPNAPSGSASSTVQFTATGSYSDGTDQDVTVLATWSSSALSVATISNASGTEGEATLVSAGTAFITATVGALSGGTMLTVTP